jgi:hypothetical protein
VRTIKDWCKSTASPPEAGEILFRDCLKRLPFAFGDKFYFLNAHQKSIFAQRKLTFDARSK